MAENFGTVFVDVFQRLPQFDCCDCGEPMERVAYHDRIKVGESFAYRFICEECSRAYRPGTEPVVLDVLRAARKVFDRSDSPASPRLGGANEAIDLIESTFRNRGVIL